MPHALLFANALKELSAGLGLGELQFDDDGLIHLDVESVAGLALRRDEDRRSLVLAGVIAPVSEVLLAALAPDLLALALVPMTADVPCLGYDDDGEMLMAYQVIPLREDDGQGAVMEAFSGFLTYIATAQRLLATADANLSRHDGANAAPAAYVRV